MKVPAIFANVFVLLTFVLAALWVLPDYGATWDTVIGEFPYGELAVDALLAHHAAYYPTWDEGYAGELKRKMAIDGGKRYGELSKGQARRVQLVQALAHRPPLLLMDEPTDGLDPLVQDRFQSPAHVGDLTMNVLEEMKVENVYRKTDSVPMVSPQTGFQRVRELILVAHEPTVPGSFTGI